MRGTKRGESTGWFLVFSRPLTLALQVPAPNLKSGSEVVRAARRELEARGWGGSSSLGQGELQRVPRSPSKEESPGATPCDCISHVPPQQPAQGGRTWFCCRPVFLRGANEGSQSLPALGTQRDLPGPLIIAGSHASPRAPKRNLHSRTFCSFCFLLKNRSRKYTHFSPPAGVGFEEAKAPRGGGRGMRRARPVLGAQALEKGGVLSQPSQAWP